MIRVASMLAAVALLAVMVGCSTTSPQAYFYVPDEPKITGSEARVVGQSEEGMRLNVDLAMDNPNDAVIQLTRIQYVVNVAGVGDFRFDQVPDRTLSKKGQQTLVLPAVFAGVRPLSGVAYEVQGTIWYDYHADFRRLLDETGYPAPSLSFRTQGQIQ